jgi:hypothetical protein
MVDVLNANQSSDVLEFHPYCEFYVPGAGWIPVEPQPNEIVGIPPAGQVRLHHYPLNRRWTANNAREIHPLCTLKRLGGVAPKYILIANQVFTRKRLSLVVVAER